MPEQTIAQRVSQAPGAIWQALAKLGILKADPTAPAPSRGVMFPQEEDALLSRIGHRLTVAGGLMPETGESTADFQRRVFGYPDLYNTEITHQGDVNLPNESAGKIARELMRRKGR
jgi:hypothetical protein